MSRTFKTLVAIFSFLPGSATFGQKAFVYKIQAGNCAAPPTTRAQTGFRVQNSPHKGIFTALHGVAGCSIITAQAGVGEFYRDLQIKFIDVGRDTALLSSNELEKDSARGLIASPNVDWDKLDEVLVFGHPYGSSQGGARLRVRVPAKRALDQEVDASLTLKLARRSSPGTTLPILSLQGPLGPGDSGAPILLNGSVIAIANGGLLGGAASLGWAIPYEEIALVPAYPLDLERLAKLPVEGLFSFEETAIEPPPSPNVLKRVIDGRGWVSMPVPGGDDSYNIGFVSLSDCILKMQETRSFRATGRTSSFTITIPLSEVEVSDHQCDCDPSGNRYGILLKVSDNVQSVRFDNYYLDRQSYYNFFVDGKVQADATVKALSDVVAACKK